MVFLFTVIPARSSAASAALPVMPRAKTSTSMRWLSVPPETRRQPSLVSAAARALALSTMLLLVGLEVGREGLLEGDGLGRDHVHQRAALNAGKNGLVEVLGLLRLAQDQAAPRAAQRLVGGAWSRSRRGAPGSDAARPPPAPRCGPCPPRPRRPTASAACAHAREVDDARVGAGAGHDDLAAGARAASAAMAS